MSKTILTQTNQEEKNTFFADRGDKIFLTRQFDKLRDRKYDFVVLGGDNFLSSVDPSVFNEPNLNSGSSYSNYMQNTINDGIDYAIRNKSKIITFGVASLLACLKSGGYIIQSVKGHENMHQVNDIFGNYYNVPSSHKQMIYPYCIDSSCYEIISWAEELSKNDGAYYYESGNPNSYVSPKTVSGFFNNNDLGNAIIEPEVVYFRNINCLSFMFHPESEDGKNKEMTKIVKYYIDLFNKNKF